MAFVNVICRGTMFALAWFLAYSAAKHVPDPMSENPNPESAALVALGIFAVVSLSFGVADGLTRSDSGRIAWWCLGFVGFATAEWIRVSGDGITYDAVFGSLVVAGMVPAVLGLLSSGAMRIKMAREPVDYYF